VAQLGWAVAIGATDGILLSHPPGLPMIAGAAIGIGAVTAGMLQLPITPSQPKGRITPAG
jgi:hypothetical protein